MVAGSLVMKEHYEISMQMGEDTLFQKIRSAASADLQLEQVTVTKFF
jgi:hypothetical protein